MPIGGSVDSTDDNYLETHCIGLQGTHCVGGTGTGIVVSTGDSTVFGHIAKLTSEPRTGLTTLEKEVLRFVIIICSIMLSMIILVIIVWWVLAPSYGSIANDLQGNLAAQKPSGLDQCACAHRGLCQRCHRLYT